MSTSFIKRDRFLRNALEPLSQNVKIGLKMKMKRGELIGLNGCLGYDYHPEDKTLTVNEEEAERIRLKRATNKVVKSSLTNEEDIRRKQQIDKDISSLSSKKSRMTDMLINGTITKVVYDDKMIESNRKLHILDGKKKLLEESINKQKGIGKGNQSGVVPNAKEHFKEKKLAVIVDNNEEIITGEFGTEMCSSACGMVVEMCSRESDDAYRNRRVAGVEILLEFLGLNPNDDFYEIDLEGALITHLQKFLLVLQREYQAL